MTKQLSPPPRKGQTRLKGFKYNQFAFKAFTLSELLITVAILGIIATFTIPKVLQNVETNQNKAKFKETIAVVHDLFVQGLQSGAITTTQADFTYILSRLNTIKVCNDSPVEGCSPPSPTGGLWDYDGKGAVLHNGVMVSGLDDASPGSTDNAYIIDVNGFTGPNEIGKDELIIVGCVDPVACDPAASEMPISYGKMTYMFWDGSFTSGAYKSGNKALYLSLWQ